ncbi:MAG: peptidoglycan-binding domain-containing protein [Desulfobaccales bacterium]
MTGADILQKAKTRLGDSYVFGALTPVGAPDPRVFDCSKLASWAVYQAAQIIYGADHDDGNPLKVYGGTIYWNRDARSVGSIVSLDEAAATPGAAVLRLATTSLCGHIVISDGLGGTVEAHSTAAGVICSTLHGRRWDLGILVPRIEYPRQQPIHVMPPDPIFRLASPLMRGPTVQRLQEALLQWHRLPACESLEADGVYGPETELAVAAFQRSQGSLVADGEAGPATLRALGIKGY